MQKAVAYKRLVHIERRNHFRKKAIQSPYVFVVGNLETDTSNCNTLWRFESLLNRIQHPSGPISGKRQQVQSSQGQPTRQSMQPGHGEVYQCRRTPRLPRRWFGLINTETSIRLSTCRPRIGRPTKCRRSHHFKHCTIWGDGKTLLVLVRPILPRQELTNTGTLMTRRRIPPYPPPRQTSDGRLATTLYGELLSCYPWLLRTNPTRTNPHGFPHGYPWLPTRTKINPYVPQLNTYGYCCLLLGEFLWLPPGSVLFYANG